MATKWLSERLVALMDRAGITQPQIAKATGISVAAIHSYCDNRSHPSLSNLELLAYCWASDQDPKEYHGLRVSNERSGDEICPQELRNAMIYVLRKKGEMTKEELIKEASLALGYKRLGKNLESALNAGIQFARSSGAIEYVPGGRFKLPM